MPGQVVLGTIGTSQPSSFLVGPSIRVSSAGKNSSQASSRRLIVRRCASHRVAATTARLGTLREDPGERRFLVMMVGKRVSSFSNKRSDLEDRGQGKMVQGWGLVSGCDGKQLHDVTDDSLWCGEEIKGDGGKGEHMSIIYQSPLRCDSPAYGFCPSSACCYFVSK